jgi:hypothetical protein
MPRVSANGDAIGTRNKSVIQYDACHAVEYCTRAASPFAPVFWVIFFQSS